MFQEKAKVLWNKNIGTSYYEIGLEIKAGLSDAKPGQFVMLDVSSQMTPLLRRPFSIHKLIIMNSRTIGISILYHIVGEGTLKLSHFVHGDHIDVLGPLGNSFTVPHHSSRIFLVAGGVGVAPMVFLASFLKNKSVNPSKYSVFIGGRSREDILCEEEFRELNFIVHTTTDDGSYGEKGLVTQPLKAEIKKQAPDIIFACGPQAMLKAIAKIAENGNLSCQVSIETMMACGMGACMGCAMKEAGKSIKYLHACKDGPVFDTNKIEL